MITARDAAIARIRARLCEMSSTSYFAVRSRCASVQKPLGPGPRERAGRKTLGIPSKQASQLYELAFTSHRGRRDEPEVSALSASHARRPTRRFAREVLLLVRRRAITKDNCLERISRLPNGACWKVLSYWREDN